MTLQVPTVLIASNPAASLAWTDAAGTQQTLDFFVVKEEWPEQDADITEHPVEIGADVTDHIRVKSPKCTLTILATRTPIASNQWAIATIQALQLPPPPGGGPLVASTLQFSTDGVDFVKELIALLIDLKNAATIFVVNGTKQVEPNMAIASLGYVRDADHGTGALITLGLTQLRFVQTQVVAAPIPAIPRGATPVNKGQQDVVDDDPPEQQSILEDLIGDDEGDDE